MNILINTSDGKPIYEQIVCQIKAHILSGELKEGEALPSMRVLAKDLRISVITTKRAYEELEHEGYIATITGKGSFILPSNTEKIKEEQLKNIELQLEKAVENAKLAGVSRDELIEILNYIYE